jgi:nicotinamide riboside transporter PnuC
MDPFVAGLGTLFANVLGGGSDFNLVDVGASFVHGFLPFLPFWSCCDVTFVMSNRVRSHQKTRHSRRIMRGTSVVLRLDYVSCVLTIASTILVGRHYWQGWLLGTVNALIMCIIGVKTAQLGFIPANLFCVAMSCINLRAWRKETPTSS